MADVAASPRSGLLPSRLRGGRWAPGHRGAVALVGVAVIAALLAGVILLRGRPVEVTAPVVTNPGATNPGATGSGATSPGGTASAPPSGTVVVAVAGKVRRPGLVRLPIGSRVDDALRAAGGVAAGADPGLLNLARLLVDGEQVLVGVGPAPGSGPTPGGAPIAGGKVNLNTATVADLDALPGIGPVLAQHVVDWRTEHGRFASIDQLREVPGIGEAKYASLRDKVQV